MTSKFRTVTLLFALVSLMILLVAFSVPLYNLFCRVTGYGGTTSFSENISNITLDKDITLQFNADVNDSIDWSFTAPKDVTFKIGENKLVEYEATNLSNVSSSGTATFNVLPEKVGPYFIKTQCFCFEKQTLEPNQSVKMPVVFYIDPSITDDPGMADIDTITLSYTFFKYIE
jgi:cytochrome c oxidase assembly protein subunit 11